MRAKQWPGDDGADIIIPQEMTDWINIVIGMACVLIGITMLGVAIWNREMVAGALLFLEKACHRPERLQSGPLSASIPLMICRLAAATLLIAGLTAPARADWASCLAGLQKAAAAAGVDQGTIQSATGTS